MTGKLHDGSLVCEHCIGSVPAYKVFNDCMLSRKGEVCTYCGKVWDPDKYWVDQPALEVMSDAIRR